MTGTGQMYNQGMIGRPAFGGKNFGNSQRIGRIGAEAVYRLGRKSNEFARLQQLDGARKQLQHR